MADKDQVTFTLRLAHRAPVMHPWVDSGDARLRFWGPVLRQSGRGGEVDDISVFESTILDGQFASALAAKIQQGAGFRSSDSDQDSAARSLQNRRQRLSREDFSVTVLGPMRYGSAEVTVLLEGVRRVAEAFDHHFELFRSALEAYAPEAWNGVVPAPAFPLSCEVRDGERLAAAFAAANAPSVMPAAMAAPVSAEDEKARRLRWLWVAANTSLILPCLLALAVLYVASQHLARTEGQLAARIAKLEGREQELVKTYQAREAALHRALLDAVKVAVDATPATACCCCGSAIGPARAPPRATDCRKPPAAPSASAAPAAPATSPRCQEPVEVR